MLAAPSPFQLPPTPDDGVRYLVATVDRAQCRRRAVGSDYRTEFGEFDSESHSVREVLEQVGSAEDAGFTAQIVFTAEQGNDAPEVVTAMTAFFERVDEVEGVKVRSPYTPENIQQNSPLESPANTSGADVSFAQLNITMRSQR